MVTWEDKGSGFGMRAVVDDRLSLFVEDHYPRDERRYRARFYLDPAGFDPGEAQNDQRDTGFFPITAAPHWVEFDWRQASAPAASDGELHLWIDGNPLFSATDLANGTAEVDFVRLGALNLKGGASGTLLWDEFSSRRLTAIGP